MSVRKPQPLPKVTPTVPERWPHRLAVLLLTCAVVIVYAGSLKAPFVFDDMNGIVNNPSIRHLWPIWDALNPPANATGAIGRPVINLSLAINHALGGLDPRGYHAFNILVHVLATLLLFGLVRRTLLRPGLRETYGRAALGLSFTMAALWALHPLLTESVTCVIQRSESLGALFYLLTLYAFGRSLEGKARAWQIVSVLACLVGMAAKEILASAPLIVLLYDRTFGAGTFKAAWRARWRYYVAMMATWLWLAVLIASSQDRGGTADLSLGLGSWYYALTQCKAIILYLKLSFWPHPLVMDYGTDMIHHLGAVWPQAVLLLTLVAATFVALVRKPVVGFLAFTFFSILAPSSSFVPLVTQTIAEHRMYLPLAALVVLVVATAYRWWPRWTIPASLGLALLGGVGTIVRNQDYATVDGIWLDTARKAPTNARAYVNLGSFYAREGRLHEAIGYYDEAIRHKPRYAEAETFLGNAYSQLQQFAIAVPHYQRAIEYRPDYVEAHYSMAYALVRLGRLDEAIKHCDIANRLLPNQPNTLHSYASTLMYAHRYPEALDRYQEALALSPDDATLHSEAGLLLNEMGRPREALAHLTRAVELKPDDAATRYALGLLLLRLEEWPRAETEFAILVRSQPRSAQAHNGLGRAYLGESKWDAAVEQFQFALRLQPDYAEARTNLDQAELLRDLRGSKQGGQ